MNRYIDTLYNELTALEIDRDQLRFRADEIDEEIESLKYQIDEEERNGF